MGHAVEGVSYTQAHVKKLEKMQRSGPYTPGDHLLHFKAAFDDRVFWEEQTGAVPQKQVLSPRSRCCRQSGHHYDASGLL